MNEKEFQFFFVKFEKGKSNFTLDWKHFYSIINLYTNNSTITTTAMFITKIFWRLICIKKNVGKYFYIWYNTLLFFDYSKVNMPKKSYYYKVAKQTILWVKVIILIILSNIVPIWAHQIEELTNFEEILKLTVETRKEPLKP